LRLLALFYQHVSTPGELTVLEIHPIRSLDSDELQDYTELTHVVTRAAREPREGIYIAESLKILERALLAGHTARSVLTTPKWVDALEALDEATEGGLAGVPVLVGPDDVVEAVAGFRVHRGTLASMNRPELPQLADLIADARRVIVLEDIVDHTNVGAVFRSVAGIGADAVIVSPSCADPLYRRSVRVSMGTVLQVPWTRVDDLEHALGVLQGHGFHVVGLALDERAVNLDEFQARRPERVALMLGAEGEGLSRRSLELADELVRIPMRHGVDSLNVAAASAVAMWALR
jgi:tRNA G18 (ribose-2'-O)-methylase SpoU